MPKFVMTRGRILTLSDYKREQQFDADYKRQQKMEKANRQWRAACSTEKEDQI